MYSVRMILKNQEYNEMPIISVLFGFTRWSLQPRLNFVIRT
jgi:hypothetical protein